MNRFSLIACTLFLAGAASAAEQTGKTTWYNAVDELSGINYDNSWNGVNDAGQRCNVSFDMSKSDGKSSVEISYLVNGQFTKIRWADLNDQTPFVYQGNRLTKHRFVQQSSPAARTQFELKIDWETPKGVRVELKLFPREAGANCTVKAYRDRN